MDIDAQIEWEKEKAAKRRIWEQEHARKKEQERLDRAREELARERKKRLDSWMSNGGSPESFDRAWPQMMAGIMEERYTVQQFAREARAEDLFS